jgi:hypothetical protein
MVLVLVLVLILEVFVGSKTSSCRVYEILAEKSVAPMVCPLRVFIVLVSMTVALGFLVPLSLVSDKCSMCLPWSPFPFLFVHASFASSSSSFSPSALPLLLLLLVALLFLQAYSMYEPEETDEDEDQGEVRPALVQGQFVFARALGVNSLSMWPLSRRSEVG